MRWGLAGLTRRVRGTALDPELRKGQGIRDQTAKLFITYRTSAKVKIQNEL